jgi:hypothetical protein
MSKWVYGGKLQAEEDKWIPDKSGMTKDTTIKMVGLNNRREKQPPYK